MPAVRATPDHDRQAQPAHSAEGSHGRQDEASRSSDRTGRGRKVIPIAIHNNTAHPLSPILKSLPLPNVSVLRAYLPVLPAASPLSPEARAGSNQPQDSVTFCTWQYAQLHLKTGKQIFLIVSTTRHAIRIFRQDSGRIPDDPHVKEEIPAAQEVFSLKSIPSAVRPDIKSKSERGPAQHNSSDAPDMVLAARILDTGSLVADHGPILLVLSSQARLRREQAALKLTAIELSSGTALRHRHVGYGSTASMQCSDRAIAISTAGPAAQIHLIHPTTLEPLCPPLVPSHGRNCSTPPLCALMGRLLAVVTEEPPRSAGPDGLGSLVCARHVHRMRMASESVQPYPSKLPSTAAPSSSSTATSALVSSAISMSGVVAKGVWAGIKTGAKAANDARASRLARSAPDATLTTNGGIHRAEEDGALSDSRSLHESNSGEATAPVIHDAATSAADAQWIKVLDLGRLPQDSPPASPYDMESRRLGEKYERTLPMTTIAHFRLPVSRYILSEQRAAQNASAGGIGCLAWNSDGTQLFVAPRDGRVFHIFQVHPGAPTPHGADSVKSRGEVLHLYELRRGNTAASVQEVQWDPAGRWIGVITERGTTHIYPLHPSGGPASALTHMTGQIVNPTKIHPLSQTVDPAVRFRPTTKSQASTSASAGGQTDSNAAREATPIHITQLAFGVWRCHPLHAATRCQEVYMFHAATGTIEAHRLSASTGGSESSTRSPEPSGLTKMMRLGAGASSAAENLQVRRTVTGRWLLQEPDIDLLLSASTSGLGLRKHSTSPLAHVEIRTHSTSPSILPPSIYLSHQVDFYAAKPIDDYSPLSIMDLEARQRRLTYRADVQVRPGSQSVKLSSFDEPLSTALQSRIESPSRSEIPGLPNGTPDSGKGWKSHIPIRTVTSGVNDGIDHVRQHYAKSQAIKRHRRASEIIANGLSFDEDTVFASSPAPGLIGGDTEGGGSFPSSGSGGVGPAESDQGVSPNGVDVHVETGSDGDWGDRWEDEYRRAVDLDGEPDDLVCGLMDEEEEERRRLKAMQMRQSHSNTGGKQVAESQMRRKKL